MNNASTNQLRIFGRVLEIAEPITGNMGESVWTKQDFVIETIDRYPKSIQLSCWGANTIYLERVAVGDLVNCNINLSSKKSGDRWFTEVTAWRVDVDVAAMKAEKGALQQ